MTEAQRHGDSPKSRAGVLMLRPKAHSPVKNPLSLNLLICEMGITSACCPPGRVIMSIKAGALI